MNMQKLSHKRLGCTCFPIQRWSVLQAIKTVAGSARKGFYEALYLSLRSLRRQCGFFRLFVRAVHLEINVDSVPVIGT